jgi:hypothetical protein
MSHPTTATDTETDKALMTAAHLETLEVNGPRDVDKESHKPRLLTTVRPTQDEEPRPSETIHRTPQPKVETASQDMFIPFLRSSLRDTTSPETSAFFPNAYMMYYIIHILDTAIGQTYYFTRSQNLWHPYITRLYFGILYHIQVLRVLHSIDKGTVLTRMFLKSFLEAFPPEQLVVPGPLVFLFQAMAASAPQATYLGKVHPALPSSLGPDTAEDIIRTGVKPFYLPNIPMLIGFANRLCSQEAKSAIGTARWPIPWNPLQSLSQAGTPPIDVQPVINGTQWSSDPTNWIDRHAWSLVTPGIEHEPETTRDQDERFSRYGHQLALPQIQPADNLSDIVNFLQLSDFQWFGKILSVMTHYSEFFEKKSSLANCSPTGIAAGQIVIKYEKPRRIPTKPTRPGDPNSTFPLVFTSKSTNATLSQSDQLYSFASNINARMFTEHPYLQNFGSIRLGEKSGPFWDIRPIAQESEKETGYYSIDNNIRSNFWLERPKK